MTKEEEGRMEKEREASDTQSSNVFQEITLTVTISPNLTNKPLCSDMCLTCVGDGPFRTVLDDYDCVVEN